MAYYNPSTLASGATTSWMWTFASRILSFSTVSQSWDIPTESKQKEEKQPSRLKEWLEAHRTK